MSEDDKEIETNSEGEESLALVRLLLHQISAPLSGIQMHISNIVEERIPDYMVKDRLKQVDSMVQAMQRQLRSFQLISEIDSLKKRINFNQKKNINSFIKERVMTFQGHAKSKGLNLIIQSESERNLTDEIFETDFSVLGLVIDNLIDNAIKYSYSEFEFKRHTKEDGHIIIAYKIQEKTLTLKITNWGYKLEPKEFEHIFSKGYRGKNAKKLSPIGAGAGLFVSKKCMEALQGNIDVIAEDDKTVFSLQLKNHSL